MTLVELLVSMVLLLLIVAALASTMSLFRIVYLRRVKMAETQIQLPLGVEILRRDLGHAGFGLPWKLNVNYQEPAPYNDSPSNPPRAVVGGNGVGPNGSDYLVLKGTNLALSDTVSKWGWISFGKTNPEPDIFTADDYVIMLKPESRELVMNGATFLINGNALDCSQTHAFCPQVDNETYLIYGLSTNDNFTRPFNRADYYITLNGTQVPSRCAQNTGVLVKALLDAQGNFKTYPLLPCVADFQVYLWWDLDEDGQSETRTDVDYMVSQNYDAEFIRDHLKMAEVFVVYHEGGKDPNFTYPSNTIGTLNYNFDLSAIPDYQHYRWEILHFVSTFRNLQ